MELSGSLCSEFIYICPVCVTPYGFPHGLGDPEMPTRCVLVRPYFPTSLRMTVATGRRGREVTVSTTILPLQTHIFSNFSLITATYIGGFARAASTKYHQVSGWFNDRNLLS